MPNSQLRFRLRWAILFAFPQPKSVAQHFFARPSSGTKRLIFGTSISFQCQTAVMLNKCETVGTMAHCQTSRYQNLVHMSGSNVGFRSHCQLEYHMLLHFSSECVPIYNDLWNNATTIVVYKDHSHIRYTSLDT